MLPRRSFASSEAIHSHAFAASTCATVINRLTANPTASDHAGHASGRLPTSAGPHTITFRSIYRCIGPCDLSNGIERLMHGAGCPLDGSGRAV